MKNPKTLYILIGIFCVLAIIAGIYAQFFVKDEDKNNIILPNLNQTPDDTIKEKTAEEIEAEFIALFTNVLNTNGFDTSNIDKIVEEQDIVYTISQIKQENEKYEVNLNLPAMNIKGEVPAEFNGITQTIFANKASDIFANKIDEKVVYQINYTANINDDILSLVIESTLKEGNNPQRLIVQTYNYNLTTGEKVTLQDLLIKKNLIHSEVQNKIDETVEKEKKKAEVLVQSGYTAYNRNPSNQMYKIENVSNFLLGPNGELYIIFAYGNQNNTSEMDIVLYK